MKNNTMLTLIGVLGITCSLQAQTFVQFTINQDPAVTADAGTGGNICPGSGINLSGNGGGGNGSYTYSWTPTGSLTGASTATPVANPSSTTTYLMEVTDGNHCTATDTVVVNVIDCSGVRNEYANVLVVYPNPSNGQFYITLQNLTPVGDETVSITSVTGAVIATYPLNGATSFMVQLANVAPGMYQVTIAGKSGIRVTRSISITH